jgi:dienelactone hydrolase
LLLGLNTAPWGGAEIGEVNRIGIALRDQVGDDVAWFRAWADQAAKTEDAGRSRLAAGFRRSASGYLLRAANYYQVGERFMQPKTDESNDAYARGVRCFRDAADNFDRPVVESVEIPYEGTSLPALYVHAERSAERPGPAMVYFDGFDVTKELQYLKGVADLARRGIACLIVDGPGNGEAIRFRNLPLHHETERYATPAYEWLAARPDVDETRIGVMAISLGGYYAPRAAAFESRFACCVAWGGQWDYHATWTSRFERLDRAETPSLSVPAQHLFWILGVASRQDALDKLRGFTLDGVAEQISCPFLLLHGEGDEQVPMADAQRCFDAVGAKDKTLRVFTREEGGYHHCQGDNISVGVAAMWDWIEQTLRPTV